MKIIDVNTKPIDFPDNSIVLLNGKELLCYPKGDMPIEVSNGQMTLDMTGEYLGVTKKTATKNEKPNLNPEVELFLKNAFLLYNNADRIMNDCRMFLTPVPIKSALAYTGTSGFRNPTLGIYVEWWLNCKECLPKDNSGNDALTYYVAGSPLSGSNSCSCVYPDGKCGALHFANFSRVWSLLSELNKRYNAAKARYEAYTLEQTISLLQNDSFSRI